MLNIFKSPKKTQDVNNEDSLLVKQFNGNAKRTLENNFIKDEDYKKLLLPTEKQVVNGKDLGGAGLNNRKFR